MALLSIENLKAHFHTRRGIVKAVDGISYSLEKGETLGIVGESGSGKSVSQLSYLGLLPTPPLKIAGGEVLFHGKDLIKMPQAELRKVRGNKISMIFQEPMTSLNPYLRIGTQLIEPLEIHRNLSNYDAIAKGKEALRLVGIAEPENAMSKYPHEFSGGMRQRVMIAMALITDPEILIADEPTTALDVTVQAQILELLKKVQQEKGMAVILITHDLGVIAGIADKVVVMYAGKVFETGTTDQIFYESQHPYTMGLLESTPRIDVEQKKLTSIPGTTPDLSKLPMGCPFQFRCSKKLAICETTFPTVKNFSGNHQSFCYWEKTP